MHSTLIRVGGAIAIAAIPLSCGRGPTSPSSIAADSSFFALSSTPDDWIGQGRTIRIEPGRWVFGGEMWQDNNRLQVAANNPSNASDFWSVTLAAPQGEQLRPGVYKNARLVAPIGSTNPSLNVYGGGRACNLSTGEFEVLEAVYGPGFGGYSGSIERFRATFSQTCYESPSGRLTGEINLVKVQFFCKVSGNC